MVILLSVTAYIGGKTWLCIPRLYEYVLFDGLTFPIYYYVSSVSYITLVFKIQLPVVVRL